MEGFQKSAHWSITSSSLTQTFPKLHKSTSRPEHNKPCCAIASARSDFVVVVASLPLPHMVHTFVVSSTLENVQTPQSQPLLNWISRTSLMIAQNQHPTTKHLQKPGGINRWHARSAIPAKAENCKVELMQEKNNRIETKIIMCNRKLTQTTNSTAESKDLAIFWKFTVSQLPNVRGFVARTK